MNYYEDIKQELINNEITKRVKDYSKNRSDLNTYYNVGKMLNEAGKHYGEGIIKEYSKRLKEELNQKYSVRYLFEMRKLYLFSKVHPLDAQLTISHYRILFALSDDNEIDYYISQVIERKLSKRELIDLIKSKEYERLDNITRDKLINKEEVNVIDFVKNPILIKNTYNCEEISEKILEKLILEDIESFMKELGNSFCFIGSEYKIKLGDTYNYIDLLLYNIEFNCYVVVELKVTELKKEHIGQIEVYMNYIDNNLKKITQDKTIGIIICKKDNKYVIEYCSDKRIIAREYELV
ncbi:MAG: PDDEXK nuclease domain-containing protein [Bacilli bacterium]